MVAVSIPALVSNEPYTPGLSRDFVAQAYGIAPHEVAKLGSAENPLGPSPKAAEAVQRALGLISIYPNWTAEALRQKIAAKYGLDPAGVVCGAGETEIISCILRAYASAGEAVLMHQPCFPIYHMYAENEGRRPMFVSMGSAFDFRLDDYLARLRQGVKIAFLTNPHSPTAKLLDERFVRAVCENARDALVVLDEAYIHFTETEGGLKLVAEYPNLIVLRTFSKAFGLAGLRVGFGAGSKSVIAPLWNIKPTWNMGQLQIAGGIAALDDDEHVARTVATIVEMRRYVAERLASNKAFRMIEPSRSNFFLLEVVDPALDSTIAFDALLKRGVIVKDCSVSFLGLGKRYLRIDVGLKPHMDRLVDALADIAAKKA